MRKIVKKWFEKRKLRKVLKWRLNVYKKAIDLWRCRPEGCDLTDQGFCRFFWKTKRIDGKDLQFLLPELAAQRSWGGAYWFRSMGVEELGRLQRVDALKKAIKEVENDLKRLR